MSDYGFLSNSKKISLITGLAAFSIYFMISSVTMANPLIGHMFHIGAREMGLVIQAHLLGTIMFLVPAARLGDIYGHIRIFAFGCMIFAASSLLCALSASGYEVIVFRFTQGIGDGMMTAAALVLLTRSYGDDKRGRALGFYLLAGYSGYVCGMIPGGLASEIFGWQAVFLITVPLTLAAGLFALWHSRNSKNDIFESKKKFDIFGMLLFCPSIILIMAGISKIPEEGSFLNLFAGLLILAFFAIWEKRCKNPIFLPEIFRNNRLFTWSVLADILYYMTTGCIIFTLSIYLEDGLFYSAFAAGIILIPSSLAQGALSPLAGHISDRIEPRYVTAAGMAIIVATLLFYAKTAGTADVILISAALAVTGTGLAFFSSPNKNAVMSSVKKELQGEASGIANTLEQTGNILSISIAAFIITAFAGTSEITSENLPRFIDSMQAIFLFVAALGVLTAFVSYKRGNLRNKNSR